LLRITPKLLFRARSGTLDLRFCSSSISAVSAAPGGVLLLHANAAARMLVYFDYRSGTVAGVVTVSS